MSLKQINTDVLVTNTNPVHLGSVSLTGAERVDIQGHFAYVSGATANNFVVIDISVPTNPVVIATVSAGGGNLLNDPYDIKARGTRLYVSSSVSDSIEIFDITDHSNITRLGGLTGFNGAKEIDVEGDILCIASNIADSVSTVDVSDPTNPVLLDTYSTDLNNLNALAMQGDYLYTGAPGAGSGDLFLVLDISDPTNITLKGSTPLADAHGFYVSGRYVYVSNNFSFTILKVVDVSDPANPVEVGSASSTEDAPNGITVAGNYAYITALNGDGVVVFDISDPTSPVEVGTILNGEGGAQLDGPHGIKAVGKRIYVANRSTPSLEILDVAGIEASQGDIGALQSNNLNVTETAKIERLDVKNSFTTNGVGLSAQQWGYLENIDQAVATTSDVNFSGVTIADLSVSNGIVQTNGSGLLSSSTILPDGTTATTQTASDNSTKIATTAYVDSAISVENIWEKIGDDISPQIPGDDLRMGTGNIIADEIDALKINAATTTVDYPLVTAHETTGIPAIGLGTGINFETGRSPTLEQLGSIECYFTNASSGSEDGAFRWKLMSSGASKAEKMTLDSDGLLSVTNLKVSGLNDVDGIIKTNGSGDLLKSSLRVIETASNTIDLISGTANLIATSNSFIDQDTRTTASPTWSTATLSSLTTAGGIVQTSGTGLLSSSVTLPNGTLATTQSPGDNSTKLATTAYVDNVVGGSSKWDRFTGTPNYLLPQVAADDIGATAARITKGWFTDLEITNMPTVGGTSINSNGVLNLTSSEVTQLANIDATTISGTQWGYVGALDQGLTTGSSVEFTGVQVSGLTTLNGIVTTNGTGVLSSSVTLPNGTLATTQSAGDNSTKVATTAYVDNVVGGSSKWDRFTGTPNYLLPQVAADDIGATAARITKGWFTDLEITNMPTVGGTSINANAVLDLTAGEVTQLANIDATTISTTQWGYLGGLDQALSTASSVAFTAMQVSGLTTLGGIVQTDGSGNLSSSVTLPDGTLCTTQSPGDNSTKLATTAYVDASIGGSSKWDRFTGTPNYLLPIVASDDIGATASRITKGWFTDLEITNMPTVGGTSINANGVLDLTTDEVSQLANIGTTTISATQWGYLGALDQALTTASSVTFNALQVSSLTTAGGIVQTDGTGNFSTSVTLPDGTLATTQAPGDNSTKIATTAYADAASGGTSKWQRITGTPNYLIPLISTDEIGGTSQRIVKGWFTDLEITNMPTVGGTSINANSVLDLTAAEVTQLANIDSSTISSAQWGFVGGLDQAVATTSSPSFSALQVSGLTTANGIVTTDGSGNLSSSVILPDGTSATTQTIGDNSTKVATTAFVHNHSPAAASIKAWVTFNTAATIQESYNITSVGQAGFAYDVTLSITMSSSNYPILVTGDQSTLGNEPLSYKIINRTSSSFRVEFFQASDESSEEPTLVTLVILGDLA